MEIVNRVRTGKYYHTYINPQKEVSNEAFKIHGISNDFLSDKPLFKHVAEDFLQFIGSSSIVIHNAGFDLGFLNNELLLQGHQPINPGKVIDTLLVARKKYPGAPASLDALCRKFNISLDARDLHGALVDADLLAQVYMQLSGGPQKSIDLDGQQKAETLINTAIRQIREVRSFVGFYEEDTQEHENYLKGIKNPIWLKNSNAQS